MPYNAEFRKQVLDTVSNLTGDGILYNRKTHTLDHVINTYIAKTCEKHSMLGYSILERMTSHVKHIFTHLNCETPYEVLEFINTVIKWYFKCIRLRRDKHTREVIVVALPDYTIHEIKELYTSILA
jgi:hypothetical protein